MQLAIISLIIFSYVLSVGNGLFGLGLAMLITIFFTQSFNIFKLKKFELNLLQIITIILIGFLTFFSAYLHNKIFDNKFGTGKITDNLGSGHYQLQSLNENKKIYITSKKNLEIGDIILLNKSYRQHGQSCRQCLLENKLQFGIPIGNFEKYLFVNGYDGSNFENNPQVIGNEKNFFEQIKQNIGEKIEKNSDYGWVFRGLILGDKSSLNSEQKETFKNAGLLHLMVASGGNIALLSSFVAIIFFFLPFYFRLILAGAVAILYTFIIGFDIPITRALIMSLFSLLAILSGRVTKPLQGLGVAFLFFGIINPYSVRYDLSFQLSFLAVLGIIIFNSFNFFKNSLLKNLFSIILTSVGASIFTFGIIVNIGNYNLLSILTNIVASILVSVLSYMGIISLFFSGLQGANDFLAKILINIAQYSSKNGVYITLEKSHYIEFLILWFIILVSFYFLSKGNKKSVF